MISLLFVLCLFQPRPSSDLRLLSMWRSGRSANLTIQSGQLWLRHTRRLNIPQGSVHVLRQINVQLLDRRDSTLQPFAPPPPLSREQAEAGSTPRTRSRSLRHRLTPNDLPPLLTRSLPHSRRPEIFPEKSKLGKIFQPASGFVG